MLPAFADTLEDDVSPALIETEPAVAVVVEPPPLIVTPPAVDEDPPDTPALSLSAPALIVDVPKPAATVILLPSAVAAVFVEPAISIPELPVPNDDAVINSTEPLIRTSPPKTDFF